MKNALVAVIIFIIACVICGIFFLIGDKYGVEHMTIVRATPTQLAQTMLQDEFYSTYRENTILTTGEIKSVSRVGNGIIVTFPTASQYQAHCRFTSPNSNLREGKVITVMTEGASAARQSTAVMLEDCVIVP